MKPIKLLGAVAFASALAFGGAASAATISGGTVIAAPTSIGEDDPTNTEIQAFNEGVGVVLGADLAVDDGVISGGTRVDSHMIFLNTEGGTLVADVTTYTFSEMILGVISDQDGTNLFASDTILNGGIDYTDTSGYGNNRGLEDNDRANDYYTISADMFSITVGMRVTEPGDWMRVVTVSEVPLPAGALLLPAGLVLLGGLRRRRKAAS